MSARLAACGFAVEPMRIEDVDNFWALRGSEGPVLCFAGHTDVVPTGPVEAWHNPPFAARIDEQGMLHGRGAADMKGSLAAMVVAVERFVADHPAHKGRSPFSSPATRKARRTTAPRRWSSACASAASGWTGASSANRRAPRWSVTW